jgi:hypothetical protein
MSDVIRKEKEKEKEKFIKCIKLYYAHNMLTKPKLHPCCMKYDEPLYRIKNKVI